MLWCEQSTPTHETKASDTVETSSADDAIDNTKDDDNSPAAESPSAPADEDSAEPGLDDAVVTAAADSQRVTTEVIERLATLVTDSWVKLATRLNFEQDDIIYFETENSTATARASHMLTVWAVSTRHFLCAFSCTYVFYFLWFVVFSYGVEFCVEFKR